MLSKQKLTDLFGYGFGLWLLGYIAGIVLFFFVSIDLLGWILIVIFSPIFIYLTFRRFNNRKEPLNYYALVSVVWTAIAVVFDYIFIVILFNNPNYYQVDVILYYLITFVVPLGIGVLNNPHK